mmetsp:Transcript_22815/g.56544  ORF Transcript_22815/g.56544 Transcript_22815/m.56544 type:complete len:229 (+) Transcript_22815:1184-1870(+)
MGVLGVLVTAAAATLAPASTAVLPKGFRRALAPHSPRSSRAKHPMTSLSSTTTKRMTSPPPSHLLLPSHPAPAAAGGASPWLLAPSLPCSRSTSGKVCASFGGTWWRATSISWRGRRKRTRVQCERRRPAGLRLAKGLPRARAGRTTTTTATRRSCPGASSRTAWGWARRCRRSPCFIRSPPGTMRETSTLARCSLCPPTSSAAGTPNSTSGSRPSASAVRELPLASD